MAGYRKGVIYTDLIDDAVRKGDYAQAARLEQERNAKIDAEGLSYEKTNRYANYLDQYDTGSKKGGYVNPYADQLEDAIADLQASRWEGWDKENDESYSAYRKAALREADRTQRDVLAQYAQNTGGIASSAAMTAASQAGDYQRSTIADKTQELYEAAFNRYLNEVQQKQQEVSMLMNAGQQAENQYYNRVNEAMTRWQQLGYADAAVDAVLGVGIGTPTSDQRYTNWQTDMTERQYADELAAAAAKRTPLLKKEDDTYESPNPGVNGGLSQSEFTNLQRTLKAAFDSGNAQLLNQIYQKYLSAMNTKQAEVVADLLERWSAAAG